MAEEQVFFSPARLAEAGSRIGRSVGTRVPLFENRRPPHEGLDSSTTVGMRVTRVALSVRLLARLRRHSAAGGAYTYSSSLTGESGRRRAGFPCDSEQHSGLKAISFVSRSRERTGWV